MPKCVEGTKLEFYYISGLGDLSPGTFGVLEPDVQKCVRDRFQRQLVHCAGFVL